MAGAAPSDPRVSNRSGRQDVRDPAPKGPSTRSPGPGRRSRLGRRAHGRRSLDPWARTAAHVSAGGAGPAGARRRSAGCPGVFPGVGSGPRVKDNVATAARRWVHVGRRAPGPARPAPRPVRGCVGVRGARPALPGGSRRAGAQWRPARGKHTPGSRRRRGNRAGGPPGRGRTERSTYTYRGAGRGRPGRGGGGRARTLRAPRRGRSAVALGLGLGLGLGPARLGRGPPAAAAAARSVQSRALGPGWYSVPVQALAAPAADT